MAAKAETPNLFAEWVRRRAHLLLVVGLVSIMGWVGCWILSIAILLFGYENQGNQSDPALLHWLGNSMALRIPEFLLTIRLVLGLVLGVVLGAMGIRFGRRFGYPFGRTGKWVPRVDLTRVVVVLMFFFLCSAFVPAIFLRGEWIKIIRWILVSSFAPVFGAIAFVSLLLWGLTLSPHGRNGFFDFPAKVLFGTKAAWVVLGGIVFVFALTNLLSYAVFDHMPHVHDGVAQVFQAKILAMGRTTLDAQPFAKFFHFKYLFNQGRWYTQYPIGHAIALLPGVLLGAPWIVNPILGSLTLGMTYLLGKRVLGTETEARLGLVLMALSPFFLFMSSEYMNHATALFVFTVFLWAFVGMVQDESWKWGVLAGFALGAMFNVRPLSGAVLALPFCLYYIGLFFKLPARRLPPGLAFIAGFAPPVLVMLWYNQATNGNPFLFGYTAMWGSSGLGFGESQWGPPHTVGRGIINTCNALGFLNTYLFEWPIPSLLFVFFLFALPSRKSRWDWLFLISTLLVITAYFFYFFTNSLMGPRFYYSALPMIVLLTTRGIDVLSKGLSQAGLGTIQFVRSRLVFGLCGCFLFAGLVRYPYWINEYGDSFLGVDRKGWEATKAAGIDRGLVFVKIHRRDRLEANLVDLGIPCRDVEKILSGGNLEFIDRLLARAAALREEGYGNDELAGYLRGAAALNYAGGIRGSYYGLGLAGVSPYESGRAPRRQPGRSWIHEDETGINYTALSFFNSPSLEDPILFPIDMGPENAVLMRAFPDRPCYRLTRDRAGNYRVSPLPRPAP